MSNIATRKRRGTTTELSSLTLLAGETAIDLTKPTLVVGDGTTVGGVPLAKETHVHANATSGTAGFMSSVDKTKLDALSAAGGVQTIELNTTPLPAETTINFNSDFSVTDNPGAFRTDFAISQAFKDGINSNTVAFILALS
jgi:hypothetical protein